MVKNVQPLFGYSAKQEFKHQNGLYYLEDYEVDIEELINRPLPPVPLECTFTAHWLAIEGVQPRIVQNPTDQEIKPEKIATEKVKEVVQEQKVKQTITQELQLYYEKITNSILSTEVTLQQLATESISQDPGIQALMPYFVNFISETVIS
jgi:transcription initiation factor TFIID subunit 6